MKCLHHHLMQGRTPTLPDVWIRPPLGGKGRKMTGQLEAHANGFRYTSPKGEVLDIMYRCAASRCHGLSSAFCHTQMSRR